MKRAARFIPAALASLVLLPTAQASHASAVSDPTARTSAMADAFYCLGGPSFRVVNRITFGGTGWIQETGLRNDGARAVRAYHPSGRSDEYRWRSTSGETFNYGVRSETCVILGGGPIRPEARNGGQWWEGQWRSA